MKHPNKDINKVVQHAIENGWTLKAANGHAWGIFRCPKKQSRLPLRSFLSNIGLEHA